MPRPVRLALAHALAAGALAAQAGDVPGETQPPLPPDLAVPAAPPRDPAAEAAGFALPDGLQVTLVAAEPLVVAPVAATFDLEGRLWVVEMRGFMPDVDGAGEDEPVGAVAVLHDDDGDGRMDRRVTFLDGLVLPRAVAPTRGGALVIAPPDLLFCRDTGGDGRADERVVVDTGLAGLHNPEHAPNGLLPTLDNAFACARHDRRYRVVDGAWVDERTRAVGQWGLTQDGRGRLLHDTNSDPLRAALVPPVEALRHPLHGPVDGSDVGVAETRVLFPARVTPGVNRGYRPGTLRDDFTLRSVTAACGPWVFRGDGLRDVDRGSAFVCEPAANLVQRYVLEPDAEGGLVARHAPRAVGGDDAGAARPLDWLTSTDERFRPVSLTGGPDGALYVVDMYRGVLQHRIFMTSWLRAQVLDRGLDAPLELGRIWRVARTGDAAPDAAPAGRPPGAGGPRGGALPTVPPSPDDGRALVEALASSHGWLRDRAQQALVERHADDATVVAALAERAGAGAAPGRVHALWALDGMGRLPVDLVERALAADDADVRHAGAWLAASRVGAHPGLVPALAALDADPDGAVRLRALLSLGAAPTAAGRAALAAAVTADASSARRRSVVLSALPDAGVPFLRALLAEPDWATLRPGRDALLETLARDVGRTRSTEDVVAVLEAATATGGPGWRTEALCAGLLASRDHDARGGHDRLRLASRPACWDRLRATPGEHAGRLADALHFPGHPLPDDRPPVRPLTDDERARFADGRALFRAACATCHDASGLGQPGIAPPLRGSPRVLGDPARLARVLLHGLTGPLDAGDVRWDQDMPALLGDDRQLADVLTYVRREWGHGADPVDPAVVAAERARHAGRETPWTVAELDALDAARAP